MSMSLKIQQLNMLNIIRDKLENKSRKILDEKRKITPHNIAQGLKDNIGDDGLTCVGRLIKDSLGDRRMLEHISWIAFRFNLPGREFSYSERDMRNWVAINSDKQGALETMHEVVRDKFDEIKDAYAPSILFPQVSMAQAKNRELIKELQERWWLYELTDKSVESCPCSNNNACRSEEFQDIEIISLRETSDKRAVRLVFCPPASGDQQVCTLGDLMHEPEEESLRKFHNFKKVVCSASESSAGLNCDFYVRVPIFFCGAEHEYMTDILVALAHVRENGEISSFLEVNEIIQILHDIVPSLKTCVSLINSQVAYSLGEVTKRDKMAGLLHAVIRHDISNFAAAVGGSVSQLLEYGDVADEEETNEILQEIRANVTLSTMFIDLDFLWDAGVKHNPDNFIRASQLRAELDKAWQFASVSSCEFNGDWDGNFLIPKVTRIVLSNLLRNSINSNINNNIRAKIQLDCFREPGKVAFGCLSEKEFPESWRKRAFEAPPSFKVPVFHRGLWICRRIAESLGGKLYLAPGRKDYKTNIRFDIPLF